MTDNEQVLHIVRLQRAGTKALFALRACRDEMIAHGEPGAKWHDYHTAINNAMNAIDELNITLLLTLADPTEATK